MKRAFILALISTGLIFAYVNRRPIYNAASSVANLPNRLKFRDLFRQVEKANALPVGLLESMAEQESRFRDDIITGKTISPAGAMGIMQIIPKWHPGVNPLDPVASIKYAGTYVRSLYNQLGSWEKALAAYNWGIANVQKKGLASAPAETKNYIQDVLARIA